MCERRGGEAVLPLAEDQEARKHRLGAAGFHMAIVEGAS